ncbi:hypothetical protein CAC42_2545 [Sphaceloma murrayae]|uniref:Las1-domain-containing protein n=1 Tax=Sphaceloma murrayae TaxID=2082308 RepID=A0A2K1QWD1_9PEZI|nr:hypothetical protein CAC42_2545 [Sphaceloma murrayae]
MSSQYYVTPWRTRSELLSVQRQILSPKGGAARDSYQDALDRIRVWALRGNLPHAVESTGLLLEAQLFHEQGNTTSIFPISATYTAALTRFVTGFADLGRSRSGPGQSMLEVAKEINLPAHFVELRHEAAHEGMPNLRRLVQATEEALEWLKDTYWSRLEGLESTSVSAIAGEKPMSARDLEQRLRVSLKEYRRSRKEHLQSGNDDGDGHHRETAAALESIARSGRNGHRTLAECLCMAGFLVPNAPARNEAQMTVAYRIWDDLLLELAVTSRSFMKPFLSAMIRNLSASPDLHYWLQHIFIDTAWSTALGMRSTSLASHVIKACLLDPNLETKRAAETLLPTIIGPNVGYLADLCAATFVDYQDVDDEDMSKRSHRSKHLLRDADIS